MNKLIVTNDLIINIDHILIITQKSLVLKTDERITVTKMAKDPGYSDYETSGLKEYNISEETFKNIKTKIEEFQSHKMYKEKYKELKTHLVCTPGGTEYLLAKQDFEMNSKSANNNE